MMAELTIVVFNGGPLDKRYGAMIEARYGVEELWLFEPDGPRMLFELDTNTGEDVPPFPEFRSLWRSEVSGDVWRQAEQLITRMGIDGRVTYCEPEEAC